MHIVIATDGQLSAEKTVQLVAPIAGTEGRVSVISIVEVPRALLNDMRAVYGERLASAVDTDAEYVGAAPSTPTVGPAWPGSDALISRYLENQKFIRTSGLVDALEAAGVKTDVEVREHENAAAGILAALEELEPDLVCVGTHGTGFFEDLLGSTSTKVVRRAGCSVMLIR